MSITINPGPKLSSREWPSREKWAKNRTTYYADMRDNVVCSRRLGDYATADEIGALTQALKDRWRELGRDLRQIKAVFGPLVKQPGETPLAYLDRYYAMPQTDQAHVQDIEECQCRRRSINNILRGIARGVIPRLDTDHIGEKPSLLAAVEARYQAAWAAAERAFEAKIAATPVDDEAWQRELEWRARVDAAGR